MARCFIPLIAVVVMTFPASGRQPEGEPPSLSFPADPEFLLIHARKVRTTRSCDEVIHSSVDYRIHGDGRMEIEPTKRWFDGEQLSLDPVALEQLLLSLDGSLHLADLQTTQPTPQTGSFVEVHLQRYLSADNRVAVDWFDALATRDLDTAMGELRLIESWLRENVSPPTFRSGNPWPKLCQPDYRDELGLGARDPVWCFNRIAPPESGPDPEPTQETIRRRLEQLPRGLQEQDGCSGYSSARDETPGVVLVKPGDG